MYRQRLLSSVCFSKYFTGVLKFKNKKIKTANPKKKHFQNSPFSTPPLTGDRVIENYFVRYEKKKLKIGFLSAKLLFGAVR